MSDRIASAVFDSREEAERALSDLRSEGINEDAISIIGRHGEQDSSDRIEGDSSGLIRAMRWSSSAGGALTDMTWASSRWGAARSYPAESSPKSSCEARLSSI